MLQSVMHTANVLRILTITRFNRCLKKLTLDDVRAAVKRAATIMAVNEKDGRTRMQHKGYSYYRDNPALSIHEVVKTILEECGAD